MTWSELQDKHSNFSVREKSLILISVLVLVWFTAINFIIEPLFSRYDELTKDNEASNASIAAVNLQIESIQNKLASDPLAKLSVELDSLNIQHDKQIGLLEAYQLSLLESDEMSDLIEEIASENKYLSLISLKSQLPEVILEQNNEGNKSPLLYKHAMSITLKGRYFALLQFMKKIEAKEESVLWGDIDYHVENYPNAVISFDIYTVSTDKEFIGVKE